MLNNIGIVMQIIAGAIIIIGAIVAIAKGGFNIFGKIGKIDNIEKGVNALLLLHHNEIISEYKDKIRLVFNPIPSPYPDREELLQKLEAGRLTSAEVQRLTEILKYEEKEAKRKDNQMAVLAIGALILLLALASKR